MPANESHVAQRVHLLLAEWVLDRLAPERVLHLATEALEQGCEAPSVAMLAGLDNPTKADIEDLVPRLLSDVGLQRPTRAVAVKELADDVARQVVGGGLHPVAGAEAIWGLWGYCAEADEASATWRDIRPFIGWASECENPGPHVEQYESDIRRYAAELLARGGVRVESSTSR